jgi:hypothetical protein
MASLPLSDLSDTGRESHSDMEIRDYARHFYVVYANLQQNDPLERHDSDNKGEAIRGNTQVTTCSLEMCKLCEMDQVDDTVEPWCHFFATAQLLQTVVPGERFL